MWKWHSFLTCSLHILAEKQIPNILLGPELWKPGQTKSTLCRNVKWPVILELFWRNFVRIGQTIRRIGLFIYFSQKFSVLRGTEISVVRPQYSSPWYRKISVKSRWIDLITYFSLRHSVVLLWTWACFFVKKSGDQLIWVPAMCIFLLRLSTLRRYERELKFPLKDFHEFLMNFLDKMVFLSCQSSWKDMD